MLSWVLMQSPLHEAWRTPASRVPEMISAIAHFTMKPAIDAPKVVACFDSLWPPLPS